MGQEPKKKVKQGIETLDMEQWLPSKEERVGFDLKAFLFQGLLLREKDFRESMKSYDWPALKDKHVAVYCSSDAIIPLWAYMLVSAYLENAQAHVYFCTEQDLASKMLTAYIHQMDTEDFAGKRLVIKGCGEENVSPEVYVLITKKLAPVARALSFGEACSTVPIWRQTA
jgi:hypothetical protein